MTPSPEPSRASTDRATKLRSQGTLAENTDIQEAKSNFRSCWTPMLLGACAGGLGWGIRGQYGHETGAMIAGLLAGLVAVLIYCPRATASSAARAVAWCAIGIGFGGSMTYGQTIGLTHDAPLIGNWAALGWGMLGLAIKGGLWIGFAGAFLGLGLGGIRYRPVELGVVMLGLWGLAALGIWLLNEPFQPAQRILPWIYFSDSWRWEPDATLKPRREVWGGLLFALCGLIAYAKGARKDSLTLRLALWGFAGGAIGFPLGQSLQAFHAWNLDWFKTGFLGSLDPMLNWWNFMETTFGAVMGAALMLGLWRNRPLLQPLPEEFAPRGWPLMVGASLLSLHLVLVVLVEFASIPWVDRWYDFGLALGLIPIVVVAAGGVWPYLVLLPVTLIPIAGKTFRQLAIQDQALSPPMAAAVYLALPVLITLGMAFWSARRSARGATAGAVFTPILLLVTWLYFGLNFAFFRFPWPWEAWTARTPNALVFTVCALALTTLARRASDQARFR